MLGLGNSLVTGGVTVPFTPESINGLIVWLKWNQNITADLNSGGGGVTHSTAAGNMANGDQINAWNGFGNTSINAVQTNNGDKPRWSTAAGTVGAVNSSNDNKHMDLSSELEFNGQSFSPTVVVGEFTIAIRFRVNDFDAERVFIGDDANEYFSLVDENTIRIKTGTTNTQVDTFVGTDDMVADKDITIIIVRTAPLGFITAYVRGEDYHTDEPTGRAFGVTVQDTTEITLNYIMAKDNGTDEWDGTFKDVLVYDGHAASASQRKELYDYLEAQEL